MYSKLLIASLVMLSGCAGVPTSAPTSAPVLARWHNKNNHDVVLYRDASKKICDTGYSDGELLDEGRRVLDIICWKVLPNGDVLLFSATAGPVESPPDIFTDSQGRPVFPSNDKGS